MHNQIFVLRDCIKSLELMNISSTLINFLGVKIEIEYDINPQSTIGKSWWNNIHVWVEYFKESLFQPYSASH